MFIFTAIIMDNKWLLTSPGKTTKTQTGPGLVWTGLDWCWTGPGLAWTGLDWSWTAPGPVLDWSEDAPVEVREHSRWV